MSAVVDYQSKPKHCFRQSELVQILLSQETGSTFSSYKCSLELTRLTGGPLLLGAGFLYKMEPKLLLYLYSLFFHNIHQKHGINV